jgi:hypothetical protein
MGRTRRLRYRHLRRTVIAALATVAAVLLLATVVRLLLQAGPTRRLVRSWIEARAEHNGVDLEIEELRWGFLPPRIQLEGVTAAGHGFGARVDRAEVSLSRFRLTSQTIELGTVVVDGVTLSMTGLPERTSSDSPKLELSVRQLELHQLDFEGTDLPGRIDLALTGMNAGWSADDGQTTGYLRIDQVATRIPGLDEFTLAVAARLALGDRLEVPVWTARGDGIDLRGQAAVGGHEGPTLNVSGQIDLAVLDRVVRSGSILRGSVAIDGVLDSSGGDLLRIDARSPHLDVAGFPVDDVAGRLILGGDRLVGELDHALFHGGRLTGRYALAELGNQYPHSVRVTGRGIAVAGLLDDLRIPPAGIASRFDTDVRLNWNGRAFKQGRGHAEALLVPTEGALPAAGPLQIELVPDGTLNFAAEALQLGGSSLDWQGPLAIGTWQPAWSITVSPAVLEEIVPTVNTWIGSRALPPVSGRGRLQVTLSGPWNELVVSTRLDARPLRLDPIELDHVVAEGLIGASRLTLSPSRFRVGDGAGEIEGSMTWSPTAGSEQLNIDLRGHRVPLATLAEWAGRPGLAGGAFSFAGGLRGPIDLPRGSWAAGLADVVIGGLNLGDATATIDLADGRFEARAIDFVDGLNGRVWWRVSDGEIGADLGWEGMPLGFLGDTITRAVGDAAAVRLAGSLSGDGHPVGRFDAATESATVTVDAETGGWTVEGRLADAVEAEIELVRSAAGTLAGVGEVRLTSAESLLDRFLPESDIPLVGTATVDLDVDWAAATIPVIAGTVRELGLELQSHPVRLLGPAHFSLNPEGLEVKDLFLGHRDDRVFMRWGIASNGAIHGNATGTLDALLLRFLVPDWEPAGRATGVIEMLGTLDRPRFEGIAEINQGSFRVPGGQTILSGINGTVLLSEDELVVDGTDFRFMQGRGRTSGTITRRAGMTHLDLDGGMTGLRYQIFPGLVARLSGPWQLDGPVDDLHVSGDLTVDRASLQRRDDPTTVILDWFGGDAAPPGEGGVGLDLRVEADQTLELRNPFVRLVGSASLHVTGSTNQPGLVGKIEFEEGGEVNLQNLRYELERGTFTFADPDRIDPIVELQLRTWVQNYQVTLRVSGTSDRLVPQVTSNPPLPQEEVYSLLAMGYRNETLGSGAMGVGVASTILSQQIASELDRRTKLVLPHVRVDPFAETATGRPAARVTVVQQLAPNWTVTLQSNLSTERAEVIVSRWYLAPGVFLEASRELDGSYGADIKMRRPY